ncbi:hypothetical protein ACIP4U_27100 [Streptomyces caelestis]|uniref:hypothetical protein n=1 Tax=Streptomyces caelestis TaxID=36816 RepID=UPI003819953D
MVIAETDHQVGCAFGFPVGSDGFWWFGFDGALPQSIEQLTASGGVFAITNILVQPHPQDQDVARRLQERLLGDHQVSLGATLVDPDDHPTLASLRSWGWLDVGEVWRPAGPTMFRALVFPLGGTNHGAAGGPGTRCLDPVARMRSDSRSARIQVLVAEQAARRGARVGVVDVCIAAVAALPVGGAGVSAMSKTAASHPLCSTDGISEQLEELQLTLGEGPCVDAFTQGSAV